MSSIITGLFNNTYPFISMVNMCPVLSTPVDWKETPEAHVFMVELPGLKKEDVKVDVDDEVDVDDGVLQISGERNVGEEDEKNGKWHRVERFRGKFCRRFKLPENAKANEVKASMENGVLIVSVAKQEVKKPEKKVIEIEEIKG